MSDDAAALRAEIARGIDAARQEEYLLALNVLTDAYAQISPADHPDGLSHLGLCIALIEKQHAAAIDLCAQAIELQNDDPAHVANLVRVLTVTGDRKRAVAECDAGIERFHDCEELKTLREQLGVRSAPPIPFLDRSNPLNQALGRARHAKRTPPPSEEVE